MMLDAKLTKIKTLRYIVASRWFLHAGIVLLGVIQKAIGVADFNPSVFTLIAVTYSYNLVFFFYLHRPLNKITSRGLYLVSIIQIILDQIIYTVVMYTTGGVESLSFLFYFLSIIIAIATLGEMAIIGLTFFTTALYVGVILLEYQGILPHYWRYHFDPGFYQDIGVTVHNSATVVFILVFTAFFAAFISNILRSREASIVTERDKLTAIIDNLVDGIIVLDATGRIIIINPYAQRLLRLQSSHVVEGRLLLSAFPDSLHNLVKLIQGAAQLSSYRNNEIQIDDDEDHLVLQVTSLQVTDAQRKRIGSLVILHNITKEKDLDRMKSEFISVAAHQLRTPLATLKWLFSMLLEGDEGTLTDKQHDLIKKGYDRNDEVIEIVNNLLDVSEIEEGRFAVKLTTSSVAELVERIVHDAQVNAQRNQITLTYSAEADTPLVTGDRQKLRMSIQNLIDNAIKYSKPGQTVTVHVGTQPAHHELVVTITDHGIGMSEETQDRLFTKFYRGKEAVVKEPTGSGLGLYIVRSIIEKHGGRIEYTSALGEGTAFSIHLPIAR